VPYLPGRAAVLGLEAPGAAGWALVLGLLPAIVGPRLPAAVARLAARLTAPAGPGSPRPVAGR
jgi:hypothetical protein